jgi:hypothetical protein
MIQVSQSKPNPPKPNPEARSGKSNHQKKEKFFDTSSSWRNSRIVITTPTKPIHLPISIYQENPGIYIAMLSNITDYSYFYLNFNSIYEKTQKQYYTNYSNIFNPKNDIKVTQF